MKTKKFSKKLGLNKATVANLSNPFLKSVRGGNTFTSMSPDLCQTKCETVVCCGIVSEYCVTQYTLGECCPAELTIEPNCDQTLNADCQL